MRSLAPAVLLLVWLAGGARAQVGFGAGVGPDSFSLGSSKEKRPASPPLGLALSLVFDTSTWFLVGVSTAAPAPELERLAAKGFYKLELIQLTLLARESGKTLSFLAERREKGAALRALAQDLKRDFDPIYDRSLELAKLVDERLDSLAAVGVFVQTQKSRGKP